MTSSTKNALPVLRRYTNLASLMHILSTKKITLLDPKTWDDQNDQYSINKYKELTGNEGVLALCFTQANETYHHWRVFAPGTDGVCIEFDKTMLMKSVENSMHTVLMKKVEYVPLKKVQNLFYDDTELPFMKRLAFVDEDEFRFLYTRSTPFTDPVQLRINLNCITRIIINPWLPRPLYSVVRRQLIEINKKVAFRVLKSRVVESAAWMTAIDDMEL